MKTLRKSLSIFLVLCLLLCLFTITASAGAAVNVIGSSTYKDNKLAAANWHNSNSDVLVEDGKIIFPKESTSDTKLVCKDVVEKSTIYNELLSFTGSLNFKSLPSGQTFNAAFALATIESNIGDAGNIEIEFSNKGGITASLNIYDTGANKKTVATKRVGSLGSEIPVSVLLTVDDKITVTVGGQTLCSGYSTGVDVMGRVGFLQTGSCNVAVSGLEIKLYNYSLPENCNIVEDFNDGEYNKNLFSCGLNYTSARPAGIYVGDYKGQGALIVDNSLVGYFSTKVQFSNFEMQYDVLYAQNFVKYNEDGSTHSQATTGHTIRFGSEYSEVEGWGGDTSGNRLAVGANAGMIYYSGDDATFKASENHNISAEENSERAYTVKLRMVDGKFTAWLKWVGETEFIEMINVDDSDMPTPTGFIQFLPNSHANMVFDNIKITNLDAKPNIVEYEHVTNKWPEIHHYEYTPSKFTYRDAEKEGALAGFNYYIITLIGAAACVVIIGVTVAVLLIVKKKKAKANVDVDIMSSSAEAAPENEEV